jgi:probable F420-dependent oxidoreductase
MTVDYDALGLSYDRPSVRIERLEEALAVIKGCFAGEAFDFTGKHYTIKGYAAEPKPVQQPYPPIVIGGGAPKILRLAGREADVVGINPNLRKGEVTGDAVESALAEATRQKIEWVREGAGDRFDDLELQIRYFVAAITDDPVALAELVGGAYGMKPEDTLESGVALCGTVDQCVETLQKRRDEWDVSYVVFGEDTFEQFAPVVAALAGS